MLTCVNEWKTLREDRSHAVNAAASALLLGRKGESREWSSERIFIFYSSSLCKLCVYVVFVFVLRTENLKIQPTCVKRSHVAFANATTSHILKGCCSRGGSRKSYTGSKNRAKPH